MDVTGRATARGGTQRLNHSGMQPGAHTINYQTQAHRHTDGTGELSCQYFVNSAPVFRRHIQPDDFTSFTSALARFGGTILENYAHTTYNKAIKAIFKMLFLPLDGELKKMQENRSRQV